MRKHSKEFLDHLSPLQVLTILKEGNQRFVNNLQNDHDHLEVINQTREGQFPFAVVLSCMDSRTTVELIFDQGLGDLFRIRIAGNIVNEDILGSIEYAIKYVGSKVLLVLGHTNCGAIASAKAGVQDGYITPLLNHIKPAISRAALSYNRKIDATDAIAYANVEHSLEEILTKSAIVRSFFEEGKIALAGGVYNVENGTVDFIKSMIRTTAADLAAIH